MGKKYYEIMIRYPVEDSDITVEEEVKHWEAGDIDVPTLNDEENTCIVEGKIIEEVAA